MTISPMFVSICSQNDRPLCVRKPRNWPYRCLVWQVKLGLGFTSSSLLPCFHHMNVTLRDQLILLEQYFLIAVVAQDEVAFEDFALELSRLTSHFNGIEANKHLDDSTTLLLSRVSQVITATCDSMLECEAFLGDAQKCSLSGPVLNSPSDDSLSMSITPPTFTPYHLLFCRVSSSGTHDIIGRNKLLDTRAYRWLMKN